MWWTSRGALRGVALTAALPLASLAIAACGEDEPEADRPAATAAPGEEIPVGEAFAAGEEVFTVGTSVSFGEGAVWTTPGLIRIEPASGRFEALPVTGAPSNVAAGEGAVWAVDLAAVPDSPEPPAVVGIDPRTGEAAVGPIWVGEGLEEGDQIAAGEGFVWVAERYDFGLKRIDPDSGNAEQVELPLEPGSVATGGDYVWVTSDSDSESAVETLTRIDPGNGEMLQAEIGDSPRDVAFGSGAVWVASRGDEGTVKQIDPETGDVTEVIPLGEGSQPGAIAASQGAIFVTNGEGEEGSDTITRIDPQNLELEEFTVPGTPADIAVGGGAVWVPLVEDDADLPPTLMRVPLAEIAP